jgi:hypothetical protein
MEELLFPVVNCVVNTLPACHASDCELATRAGAIGRIPYNFLSSESRRKCAPCCSSVCGSSARFDNIVVTLRISETMDAQLRTVQERDGIPVSEQIRRGIQGWLKKKGVMKADRKRAGTRKRS